MLNDILGDHYIFESLDEKGIEDLVNKFLIKSYETEQYVFHQGDEANRLYIILSGTVSIEKFTQDGKTTQFIHLSKGDIFGEFAVIDEGVRSAGARIIITAELASLSKSAFHDLLDENPLILKRLLSLLVERLRNSNHQIESLATFSLLQRTAGLLLKMSERDGSILNVTQKQLSEKLFASREKVNAKLKELELSGAIKRGHRKIEIISSNDLQRWCENIL